MGQENKFMSFLHSEEIRLRYEDFVSFYSPSLADRYSQNFPNDLIISGDSALEARPAPLGQVLPRLYLL